MLKKRLYMLVVLFATLFLFVSCGENTNNQTSTTTDNPGSTTTIINSTTPTTTSSSVSTSASTPTSTSTITPTTSAPSTTTTTKTSKQKVDPASLKEVNIDLTNVSSGDTYQTNFNNGKNVNGINLGGYRIGRMYSQVYPYHYNYKDTSYEGREGAIYNTVGIETIYSIEVEYTASNSYGRINPKLPNVKFGTDMKCSEYKFDLDSTSLTLVKQVDVSDYDFKYFSINTGDFALTIDRLSIKYSTDNKETPTFSKSSGDGKVRFNPVTYTGTLTAGESKIKVPTGYSYDASTKTYTVTSSKELTYYTLDYVRNHPESKAAATITDPMEVCIYYATFKRWPANYSKSPNQVKSVFGSDARKVSTYSRTDGYALSVPWRGNGQYHELDIDFDGTYTTSSRGTGRVVVWESGWNNNPNTNIEATGYDNSPVCVYTDDHYNTWLEYLNNGTWSNRFNAEGKITGIAYSPANTVTYTGFDPEMVNGSGTVDIPDPVIDNPVIDDPVIDTPVNSLPVDDGTINHLDYYGNYAPLDIINEYTALFQKVTCDSGLLEGAKYALVSESKANGRAFLNNMIENDSLIGDKSLNIDSYDHMTTISFEKKDDKYYISIDVLGMGNISYLSKLSYSYDDRTWGETMDKESATLWNVYFANGHIVIAYENEWFQFNPDATNNVYTLSNDIYEQFSLYRYCDIEGATPFIEEPSNFEHIDDSDSLNDNDSYVLVSILGKKALTDESNAVYELTNKGKLKSNDEYSYEELHIIKHDNPLDSYYEIYKIKDDVKYYLTINKENLTDVEFSLTPSYVFINVYTDDFVIIPIKLQTIGEDIYPMPIYREDKMLYLRYFDEDGFVFSDEIFGGFLDLYKILPQENSENGNENE